MQKACVAALFLQAVLWQHATARPPGAPALPFSGMLDRGGVAIHARGVVKCAFAVAVTDEPCPASQTRRAEMLQVGPCVQPTAWQSNAPWSNPVRPSLSSSLSTRRQRGDGEGVGCGVGWGAGGWCGGGTGGCAGWCANACLLPAVWFRS